MDNYNNGNYNDETQLIGNDQAPLSPPTEVLSDNPFVNQQPNYQQPAYNQQPVYNPQPVYNQQANYQQNYNQQGYNQQANYGQQPNYQQPVGRVVKPRNLVLYIVFTLISCSYFAFYWMYTLTEDVKELSGDHSGTSGGMTILFAFLTCGIYSLFWMYKQGDAIDKMKVQRGMPAGNSGILYLVLAIFGVGIVSYALMQNEVNKLCA